MRKPNDIGYEGKFFRAMRYDACNYNVIYDLCVFKNVFRLVRTHLALNAIAAFCLLPLALALARCECASVCVCLSLLFACHIMHIIL